MKRSLLVLFVLCIFVFSLGFLYQVSANVSFTQKDVILNTGKLENIKNGKKYISQLEKVFEILEKNRVKLENLHKKISQIKENLDSKGILSEKEKDTQILVDYIYYKSSKIIEKALVEATLQKTDIVLFETKNSEEIFNDLKKMSLEEFEEYLYGLDVNELEKIVDTLYNGDGNLKNQFLKIYKNQIEKGRDVARMNNLNDLGRGIEQVYQDKGEYPNYKNFIELVTIYLPKIPQDPLAKNIKDNCYFGYKYEVGDDENGLKYQNYKLSTCFENLENTINRAGKDGGIDENRFEIGSHISSKLKNGEEFYLDGPLSDWKEYTGNGLENIDFKDIKNLQIKRDVLIFAIEVYNPEIQ